MCFGAQKNNLIETVLLSTHNICFGGEKNKLEELKVLKHSPDIGSQCSFQDFSHINKTEA